MNRVRWIRALRPFLGLAAFLAALPVGAQELTARQMMEKCVDHAKVRDETTQFQMTLAGKSGGQQERRLVVKRMEDSQGLNKALIRFQDPPDIRGTTLLTWEQKGRDDDQWIYLPALKKTKRISGSDKQDSFVGSDLSYEDLRSEELDNFTYTKVGEDTESHIIEVAPKKPEESSYSKRKVWLRKDNFFAATVEYYDKKGTLLKTARASNLTTLEGGKVRANQLDVKNAQNGHSTVLRVVERRTNTGLSEGDFSQRELEKGV